MRNLLVKLKSWEFWPVWLIYIPVFFVWLWYSLKSKSFFFFTTVNPKIEMGGFAGESKIGILNQIPEAYIPETIFISTKIKEAELIKLFQESYLNYPCIVKPDVGERGKAVVLCKNETALVDYFRNIQCSFLIQEFIDLEIELAVLYYRFPYKNTGKISSLCQKEFLSIEGNGINTVKELIHKDDRAFLQLNRLEKEQKLDLSKVLKNQEKLVLDYIGNHSRGTTFLDKNYLIDKQLILAFDKITRQIPDLHFGRFDLKCKSIEDLKQLKNFSILEINGVSAEPAHVYQPGFPFFQAEKALLNQWKVIYEISKLQIERGVKPMKLNSAIRHLKQYRSLISLHTK